MTHNNSQQKLTLRKRNRRVIIIRLYAIIGIVVCIFLLMGETSYITHKCRLPEPQNFITYDYNTYIPMRDGVELATDLYFPADSITTQFPTLLIRTPYWKIGASATARLSRFFTQQGYVVAVQQTRGNGMSEGTFEITAHEANDGYDTITWLVSQPWCNGKVGTFGWNYMGENQALTAKLNHPNHTAMIAHAAGGALSDSYRRSGWYEGGALCFGYTFNWFMRFGKKERGHIDPVEFEYEDALFELPLKDKVKRFGNFSSDWNDVVSHNPGDPWWERMQYIQRDDSFNIPTLHINSWFDSGIEESLSFFRIMRDQALSATAAENQFVVIGPTVQFLAEEDTLKTKLGDMRVGDSRYALQNMYLQWFDYWLKGIENGVTDQARISLYCIGKNEWRAEQQWPLERTEYTKYFLHSNGNAHSHNSDGVLGKNPPQTEPADEYLYDPAYPVPSSDGIGQGPYTITGPQDRSEIEKRPDVLVYTSPKLSQGLEMTGPVKAVLYVSSSARDTDFTVKLVDVSKSGKALTIQQGILRARYREGFESQVWMQPNEVYKIEVDLHSTSYYFKKGHRIRVEISSSDFPRYDRNLNTGGDNFTETEWEIARNVVFHSTRYPSHIVLPLISQEEITKTNSVSNFNTILNSMASSEILGNALFDYIKYLYYALS